MAAQVRGLYRLIPSLEGPLLFPLMVGGLRHDLLLRWVLPRCRCPRLWLGCLGTPTSQPGSSWSLGLSVASLPMKETGQAAPGHQAYMGLYHPWRGLARQLPKKRNTAGQDSPHGFPVFQAGFPLNRKVKFHSFSQRGLAFLSQHFQAALRAGSLRVLAEALATCPLTKVLGGVPSPKVLGGRGGRQSRPDCGLEYAWWGLLARKTKLRFSGSDTNPLPGPVLPSDPGPLG